MDRRLGDDAALAAISRELHRRGIRLVLDAVFNHTGRDFWAFRDIREKGRASAYCDWYHLDFTGRSPYGEPFHYKGWNGNYDLVKLNLANPAVREHLFSAVSWWIEQFQVDGLRLDAADALDFDFQRALAAHCRAIRPDFWLMGEVVHGDYRRWAYPAGLSSTTNYVAYKGLWSSHNDQQLFRACVHAQPPVRTRRNLSRPRALYLRRQSRRRSRRQHPQEPRSPVSALRPADDDAGRAVDLLRQRMGHRGAQGAGTDAPLRPAIDPATLPEHAPHPELHTWIKSSDRDPPSIATRCGRGDYTQLHVAGEQFAFHPPRRGRSIVVAVNAADHPAIKLRIPDIAHGQLIDALNDGRPSTSSTAMHPARPACRGRVLEVR